MCVEDTVGLNGGATQSSNDANTCRFETSKSWKFFRHPHDIGMSFIPCRRRLWIRETRKENEPVRTKWYDNRL